MNTTSEQDELDELYQSIVLEHSKKPRNFGKIECSCYKYGKNPNCGDEITVFLNLKDNIITDISFIGEGCALCISTTSLLTMKIKGKSIIEATNILNEFSLFIIEKKELNEELEPLHIFSGVTKFPLRIKCVLLSCRTIETLLKEQL